MFLKEFEIYGLRGVAQPLQQPVLILAEWAVSRAKLPAWAHLLRPVGAGWAQHLSLGADSVQDPRSVLGSPASGWCFGQGKLQELGWGWS